MGKYGFFFNERISKCASMQIKNDLMTNDLMTKKTWVNMGVFSMCELVNVPICKLKMT